MNILKKIFNKGEQEITSYDDFWNWFQKEEKYFYKTVKSKNNIVSDFFEKLSPKLNQLKEGYFYLTGMLNDDTAELIITADGNPKNIVYVEELIAAAPTIKGWQFTAFKQPKDLEQVNIHMADLKFNKDTIRFYANPSKQYPDEINITFIHTELTEANRNIITNGVFIFLDSYLGELEFLYQIDQISIAGPHEAHLESIPLEKLKDYLIWREKEFIEKYEGTRYDTEKDTHSLLEAVTNEGLPMFININADILQWDAKPSHPWIVSITFTYDGSLNNGLPNRTDYLLLEEIQDKITSTLTDKTGHLYIGRKTVNGEREIYFACKEFRQISKTLHETEKKYSSNFKVISDIYRDKYWKVFEKYQM